MKIVGMIKRIIRVVMLPKKEIIPIITHVDKEHILQGKVALITGGSSGIGFAIAQAFLNSGCKVIIAGSNLERLEAAAKKLGEVQIVPIDITDVDVIPDKIKNAAALFRENRIDILVNSAGMHHTLSFENMTESEYDKIMDTNVKGTFLCHRQ